jgi:hypothetical protein
VNMFAHPRLITLDVKEPAPSTASAGSGGGGGWAGTGESPWLPGSGGLGGFLSRIPSIRIGEIVTWRFLAFSPPK